MPNDSVVAVLIVTPWGIPVVRDPKKPKPVFWKLPGGKGKATEKPEAVALRELKEETGVRVPMSELRLVASQDRGSHTFFVFDAHVSAEVLLDIKQKGDEGEEIEVLEPDDLLSRKDFFPPHLGFVKKILEAELVT
jgi:8-oxo-dGTP pyrophosphatase MutT (NUDIX family)